MGRAHRPSKCTPKFRQPRGLEQTRRIEYGKRQRTIFAIETWVVRTFGMSHLLWTTRSSGRFGNSLGVAGCFVRRGRDFTFRYSGNRRLRFRDGTCIELDDEDRALLKGNRSAELGTRAVVRRSGILDLLPAGLDDYWQRFGTVLEENVIGTWRGRSDPILAKGGHKVWVIPRV
jgi:hypothetical protein